MKNFIQLLCALSLLSLGAVSAKKKAKYDLVWSKWLFSESEKSPINDSPSVSARSFGDTANFSSMVMGCEEGRFYFFFQPSKIRMSTHNERFYPFIYRVDSQAAIDCTADDYPEKCSKWALRFDGAAVGIWGDAAEEFVEEIKDAKKLTIRVSRISGQQETVTFTLKDVLPTFEKVKGLCGAGEPTKTTKGESAP